jgi:hypothetical protein
MYYSYPSMLEQVKLKSCENLEHVAFRCKVIKTIMKLNVRHQCICGERTKNEIKVTKLEHMPKRVFKDADRPKKSFQKHFY